MSVWALFLRTRRNKGYRTETIQILYAYSSIVRELRKII